MANFAAVMRKFFCLTTVLAAIIAAGCSRDAEGLRSGDLLFVYIPGDYDICSDTTGEGVESEAVSGEAVESTKATASGGAAAGDAAKSAARPAPLNIHVAILEVSGDSIWIVDATIKRGVARYPLQDFFKDFTLNDGGMPQLSVMRPRVSAAQAQRFVSNARQFAGMPYDVDFLMDNDAMYCSELVYDAYVTDNGEHLFSVGTIDFLSADGTVPLYWRQIFELLQRDIPQGRPGIMPADVAASHRLGSVEYRIESLE